jgi:plasmid stabilization system protein ParE
VKDDPLSDAELAFVRMVQQPARYAGWAAEVRAEWQRERGVEWLHGYRHGRQIWKGVPPPPDPDHVPQWRFNPNRAAVYAARKLAASNASIGDTPRTGTHPSREG